MSDSSVGTVTVMFTDLVGSTQLRTRLGEEAAEVLRGVHDSILSGAITSNGGQVVKHLGDGMMATFASAAGAVAAGVALQQEIDMANRRGATERMQVRVGISVGDVTFEGDDCFGLPVVEAQRLEASAEPGTIRCAALVMHLARGRGGHEFRPLGDLELKGLAEPLAACEVGWVPLAEQESSSAELELPPVFAHAPGLPFSGREEVFEKLVDAWKRCNAGGFAVVMLAGEPGIGKTRLAQELATRVQGVDALVLAGRCDEDVAVPFQAFGAALDWFVKQTVPEHRLAALGEYPGDLVRLVPDLDDRVGGLPTPLRDEPDTERFRLFQAVESWLSVGGGDRPRLFVIDDLHWADKPTLLLLRHLITAHPAGLMVLCTYRDTDVDRTHPLSAMLADFRRMEAVARIGLDGLGSDGVRELLVRTGGHDLDEAGLVFAELVHRETSGNPFFLGEVLRHLAETGALVERDGRWTSDLTPEEAGIPEGIREVVGRRLSRLGPDVEQVLRSAAVIGYEFDVDLLADVVGGHADSVLDALDTAIAASLAVEVGVNRYRFAHALVRETLHGELSASRRSRQHRKVAEALEVRHANDLDAVITELATHWMEASAGGDPTRAIELTVQAGAQAADRGAYESAVRWFETALELMEDVDSFDADRCRTLVRLAESQCFSGAVELGQASALAAATLAVDIGDVDTACEALGVTTRGTFIETDAAELDKTILLRRALALPALTDAQRAELVGTLSVELIFERDLEGRRVALHQFFTLLPSLSPVERAHVLTRMGPPSMRLDRSDTEQHARFMQEALDIERAPTRVQMLLYNRSFIAFILGQRDVLDAALARMKFAVGESSNRLMVNMLLIDTMLKAVDGKLDLAEESSRAMVRLMKQLDLPERINFSTSTRVMINRERGTLAELGSTADVAEQLGHATSSARAIAAMIRLAQGRVDEAAAGLDLIRGEELPDDAAYPMTVGLWSEIAVAIGSDEQCRTLADMLEPQTTLHLGTGGSYFGAVDRLRALLLDRLGEHQQADELFAAAVRQHEQMGAPPWVARTQIDRATSLLARGERAAVQAHLDAAASAIGDLDLAENQHRLAALSAALSN